MTQGCQWTIRKTIYSLHSNNSPPLVVCLDVARRLERSYDPQSNAGASFMLVASSTKPDWHGLQEKGLAKLYPGTPGWGFGAGLTTLPC